MTEYQPPFIFAEHTDSDLFEAFDGACQIPESDKVRFDDPEEPQFVLRTLSGLQFSQRGFSFEAYKRHLQHLHENSVSIPPSSYQQDRLGNVAIRAAYITSEYPDAFEAIRMQEPYERMTSSVLPGIGEYYSWCHEDPAQSILHDLNGLWQYRYGIVASTSADAAEARWWLVDIDAGTSPLRQAAALSGDLHQLKRVVDANYHLKDL